MLFMCAMFAGCSGKDGSSHKTAIDLDISKMSGVLAYSTVVNISESANEYMGKTVKIRGQYYATFYDETQKYYHWVVVGDETLCCRQGLEFVWDGDHRYPGDYPDNETDIEVVGVFGSYDELGRTYYFLTVDDIEILKKQ